jgi:hypothetical protein
MEAYSYIPDDSVEQEIANALEFEQKMKAISIRILILSVSFWVGFKIMIFITKIYYFFFPKPSPWKSEHDSTAIVNNVPNNQEGGEKIKSDIKKKK